MNEIPERRALRYLTPAFPTARVKICPYTAHHSIVLPGKNIWAIGYGNKTAFYNLNEITALRQPSLF